MAVSAPASGTTATSDPFAAFGPQNSVQQAPPNGVALNGVGDGTTPAPIGGYPGIPNPATQNGLTLNGGAPIGAGTPPDFGTAAAPGIGGGLGTSPFNMNPADPTSASFRRIKPQQTGSGSAGMGNAQAGAPDTSVPTAPARLY